MDDYLIDRETLGKFVDELIKEKALPVENPEELNQLRENAMKTLDDRIGMAIFGSLTEDQNNEINQILDRNEENPDVFRDFFAKAGINAEEIIANTMQAYSEEFLGGENA